MTTEHDFQKAIDAIKGARLGSMDSLPPKCYANISTGEDFEVLETIRFALRLADKLLGQEPSFEMKQAGSQKVGSDYEVRGTFGIAVDTFKSMLTTAVKEIENDRTRSQF